MKITNGIDVSYAQGAINWSKTNDYIDFCFMRIGYGRELSQKDKQFEANYKGCKKPKGGYWYNYATTVQDAITEAKTCAKILNGRKFELPIFYDIEEQKTFKTGKTNVTNIARAFINEMHKQGYSNVGIYASGSPLITYFDNSLKNEVPIWVAWYDIKSLDGHYKGKYAFWQHAVGKAGTIPGIASAIDLDYGYVDIDSFANEQPQKSTNHSQAKTNQNGTSKATRKPAYAKSFENSLTGSYKVTAAGGLYLRYEPGVYTKDNVVMIIPKGTVVQNYGYFTDIKGVKWLYIKNGNKEGFSASTYLKKV